MENGSRARLAGAPFREFETVMGDGDAWGRLVAVDVAGHLDRVGPLAAVEGGQVIRVRVESLLLDQTT